MADSRKSPFDRGEPQTWPPLGDIVLFFTKGNTSVFLGRIELIKRGAREPFTFELRLITNEAGAISLRFIKNWMEVPF